LSATITTAGLRGTLKDRCTGRGDTSVAQRCYQLFGERKTDVLHRAGEVLPGRLTADGAFSTVCKGTLETLEPSSIQGLKELPD